MKSPKKYILFVIYYFKRMDKKFELMNKKGLKAPDDTIDDENDQQLTESQLSYYVNPLQEQSFSPSIAQRQLGGVPPDQNMIYPTEIPSGPSSNTEIKHLSEISKLTTSDNSVKEFRVVPEEVIFENVAYSKSNSIPTVPRQQKVLIRNQTSSILSLKFKFKAGNNGFFNITVDPLGAKDIQAFQSTSVRIEVAQSAVRQSAHEVVPLKIHEQLVIESQTGQCIVPVTIVPKQLLDHQNTERSGSKGSAYKYDPNNESLQSSRLSQYQPGNSRIGSALERMRSMSKEIKDQRKSRLGQSSLMESKQGNPTNESIVSQKQDTFRQIKNIVGSDNKNSAMSRGNNMTASFNQEEIDQLNKMDRNTFYTGNQNDELNLQELSTSQNNLRNDIDDSQIEEPMGDDIQRSQDQGELNFDDMTQTNTDMDGRDPNDQSLSLNQLQHSQYTYSKTNKSHLTNNMSALGNPTEFSLEKTEKLKSELMSYRKIIEQQQSRINEEVKQRQNIQEALNKSKLNNEETILNKIQALLREEEPKLEEIMNLSLRQERQRDQEKQAQKDQQVLAILKQKDREIEDLQTALETAHQHAQTLSSQVEQLKKQKAKLEQNTGRLESQISQNDSEVLDQLKKSQLKFEEQTYAFKQLDLSYQELQQELLNKDNLVQELEAKLEQVGDDEQNQLVNENRVLVQELERLEQEKQVLMDKNDDIAKKFREQANMLKEKLNQSYQDIQRLVKAQKQLQEQNIDTQGIFDTKDTATKTNEQTKAEMRDGNAQTELDMQQMEALMKGNLKNSDLLNNSLALEDKYLENAYQSMPGRGNYGTHSNSNTNLKSSMNNGSQVLIPSNSEKDRQSQYIIQQLEAENNMLKGQIQSLEIQMNTDSTSGVSKTHISDGLQYEELAKLADSLKRQNQQLQIKLLDIKDVEEFGSEPANPLLTLGKPMDKNTLKHYDSFQIEQIIEENFQLKSCTTSDPANEKLLQTINQLKEQIKTQEQSFKEEAQRMQKNAREQQEKMFNLKKRAQSDSQSQERELKIAINKLQILYSTLDIGGKNIDETELKTIEQQQSSLKIASQTILSQRKEIDKLESQLIAQSNLNKVTAVNRILANRHQFLIMQMSQLYKTLHGKNQKFIEEKQKIINVYQGVIDEVEPKLQDYNALRTKVNNLEREKFMLEQSIDQIQISNKQKAEQEYDERMSRKQDKIQLYFDNYVMQHLRGGNAGSSNDTIEQDTLELTRQFVNLQNQLDKQQQTISYLEQENTQLNSRLEHLHFSNQKEKKSPEKLGQEFESIKKLAEQLKQAHLSLQQNRQETEEILQRQGQDQFEGLFWKYEEALKRIDLQSGEIYQDHQELGNDAQQQIFELRAQHLMEMEEIKTNCELEMAQEKRDIQMQRKLMGQGHDPEAVERMSQAIQQNEALLEENNALNGHIGSLRQEQAILEQKFEEKKRREFEYGEEIRALQESLKELQAELLEPMTQQHKTVEFNLDDDYQNVGQDNTTQSQSNYPSKSMPKKKINPKLPASKTLSRVPSQEPSAQLLTNRSYESQVPTNTQANISNNNRLQLFTFNPPFIIQHLISQKLHQKGLERELQRCQRNEVDARQEVRRVLAQQLQEKHDQGGAERYLAEERLRSHDLEMKIRDMEIQNIQEMERVAQINEEQAQNVPNSDYMLLVNTIMHLINKDEKSISENEIRTRRETDTVYKLIILQLTKKLQRIFQNGEPNQIDQFVPLGEKNQKIWYLELLESQLVSAEQMVNRLFDFVQRLQIDIQGSLTSAAQIKATSMDLATNIKEASEEIKLLQHVGQLIRSDLDQMGPMNQGQITQRSNSQATITPQRNPFLETANYGDGLNNFIDLQNQLTITNKVKGSLEQELVTLKKTLFESKNQFRDQVQELQAQNQQLQTNVEKEIPQLRQENKKLKKELLQLQDTHKNLASEAVNELDHKDRETSALAKNQSITSKNLSRLQAEMQEWRKTTDANQKIKDQKIQELTNKLQVCEKDLSRSKAENSMLRRNQKEWLGSTTKQMEEQKNDLEVRVGAIQDESERQMKENIQLRETIKDLEDQLAKKEEQIQEKKGQGMLAERYMQPGDTDRVGNLPMQMPESDLEAKTKKLRKKLMQKDEKVKQLENKERYLHDEIVKLEELNKRLDQHVEKTESEVRDKDIGMTTLRQTIKQLELEIQMLQAEKMNRLEATDLNSQQIQTELDTMRQAFAQLKIEKEGMLNELEKARRTESQWKTTVEKLKRDIDSMNERVTQQNDDQAAHITELQAKEDATKIELKLLRNENLAIKQDNKMLYEKLSENEMSLDGKEQQTRLNAIQLKESNKQINELKTQVEERQERIEFWENEVKTLQMSKDRFYIEFNSKLSEIAESRQNMAILHENQLQTLRQKLIDLSSQKDPNKPKEKVEKEVDLNFTLLQRDTQIKNLKKEVAQLQKQLKQPKPTAQKPQKKNQVIDADPEDFDELICKVQNFNNLQEQMLTVSAQNQKTEGWNMVLLQQQKGLESTIADLRQEIEEMVQKECDDAKTKNTVKNLSDNIKVLRGKLKDSELEITQLKSSWISPERQKMDSQHLKELQAQVKQLKDEAARKKEFIQSLKQSKEAFEKDHQGLVQQLQSLKDENAKIKKNISAQGQSQLTMKTMKIENDAMKQNQTRLQNEVQQLTERVKQARNDVQRKDQMIRDLKNQAENRTISSIQQEHGGNPSQNQDVSKDLEEQKKRLKEVKQRHKVEIEIKENQIRSLKQRVEQQEEVIAELRQENEAVVDMPMQIEHGMQLEKQQKKDRLKLKRYDQVVKKSLGVINKISVQLGQQAEKKGKSVMASSIGSKSASRSKMGESNISGLPQNQSKKFSTINNDVEEYKALYKDSVDILGVSLDELEEFMNPEKLTKNEVCSVERILDKFRRMEEEKDDVSSQLSQKNDKTLQINDDIEVVHEYCAKLIESIAEE